MEPQDLIEALQVVEELGMGQVRERYSGRCMYGRECPGVVTTDGTSVMALVAEIVGNCADEYRDDLVEAFRRASTDAMGLDEIIYFPSVQWAKE